MTPYRFRGSGQPGAPIDRNPGAAERIPADSRSETAAHRRAAVMWSIGWEAARLLPEPVAFALADLLARAAHRIAASTRARVRANLARVVPAERLDATVRDAFRSYGRYWVEAFRAADMDPGDLDRRTTVGGFEHLDGVLDHGRGAIVLLAHHGSWDVAARWAESHQYHMAVVAEIVRPRRLFEKFVRLRESIGLEVVPLQRGQAQESNGAAEQPSGNGRATMVGRLARVLDENHLVGLLADRDLSKGAPHADFFGEPCRIPMGAAVLSRRRGVPIVPITMLQAPARTWHLQALPAIDTTGMTVREAHEAVVGALEDLIRLDPAQWHAFQPVWQAPDAEAAQSEDPQR